MSTALEVRLTEEQLDSLAERVAMKIAKAGPHCDAPLSVKQAAKALGLSSDTIRSRVKAGMIRTVPDIGITRIPKTEIDRLLSNFQTA